MATARRLPSGNYFIRVFTGLRNEKGQPIYQCFTAPTKKGVEFLAADYALSKKKRCTGTQTIGDAITQYIASKDSILSPATVRVYNIYRKQHYATIEHIQLSSLTLDTLQAFVNRLSKSMHPKTVRNVYALLTASLNMYAPDLRTTVTLPQKIKPKISIPNEENIKALLSACKGTPLYTAILLGSSLGLRRSEICALVWKDLSVKDSTSFVSNP